MEFVRRGPMRREDARVAFTGRVRAFRAAGVEVDAALTELRDVSATDVSAGGMRLETSSREVAVGDWIAVVFPFSGARYRILGSVVWTSATTGGTLEFAVRFEGLSAAAKRTLRTAINRSRFRTGGFLDRRHAI